MPRQMTQQEAHDFLDSKPGWIALTTVGPDGFPHTVPTGYFRLGDDVLLGVRNNTLKIRNIRYNPQVSLMIESGSTRQDIKGVMIQGNATVIDDPDEIPALCSRSRQTARRRRGRPAHRAAPRRRLHQGHAPQNPLVGLLGGRCVGGCHDYCNTTAAYANLRSSPDGSATMVRYVCHTSGRIWQVAGRRRFGRMV